MQESGHRAAAIVQDLLTVARGVATTREPLHLNEIISDYLNSPEFKKLEKFNPAVTVKTNIDTELLNISGSQVHIRKVLMNLVSNASEAIEGSGNVTISTMNRYVDRPLRGYDDVTSVNTLFWLYQTMVREYHQVTLRGYLSRSTQRR